MKCQTFFTRYTDTWILGPAASADTREFRIGLGLIVCEVGLCFTSERISIYGCSGCNAIGQAPVDQMPPGWEKRHRPDSTYYFLCPKCIKEGHEPGDDYVITDENRQQAIDEIIGQLVGDKPGEIEVKALRAYANKLLDESEPFGRDDLAASVAAYSDGFSDARGE